MISIKSLLVFGLIILLLDIPCIIFYMAPMYKSMGMASKLNIFSAILAYVAMILAWFLSGGDPYKGALAGFVIYGTYAYTLAAVLPQYKFFPAAVSEVTWGTFLFCLATIITKKITG